MQTTKYSAGPWELDSAKDGDTRYQIIHGQLPKGINGDFGYPVADTMNRHHCISPEEDVANGQLMASAPALLSALKAIIEAQRKTLAGYLTPEMIRNANSAIDAAEGR